MKNYLFISILLLAAVSYFFTKELRQTIKSSRNVELKKEEFKTLPQSISETIFKKAFVAKNYKKIILSISKDKLFHYQVGEKLYQLAFSKANYSEEKIRLLQMAKEHFIYAKELGI